MRAAVFTAVNAPFSVQDLDPLPPGPRDVVVRLLASGVCHSDLLVTQGAVPFDPPMVLGHEGVGVVEEVGAAVERVRPGDLVIGSVVLGCGTCDPCIRDEEHLCIAMLGASRVVRALDADGRGITAGWGLGAFAETMTVDERSVVRVTAELPPEQLALIGCSVATGVGAVLNSARVPAGATVAVVGCGGIGLATLQGARLVHAARIIGIDPVVAKRKHAIVCGATDVVDPADGDVVEQVRDLTDGQGVDFAFEAVGLPLTILQSHQMTRRGGVAVMLGMPPAGATVTFPAASMRSGGRTIVGCTYGSVQPRRDFPKLAALAAAGHLDLGALVSHRIKLDELNEAYAALERGEIMRSVIV